MHWLALGMAWLVALAIIAIGIGYLARPRRMTGSFGLPLPEDGPHIAGWLRLKGVRDVVAGLAVLAFLAWGGPREVGLLLLVEALIPLGDMLVVLAAKGSIQRAPGVHGLTAALMVVAAVALLTGVS